MNSYILESCVDSVESAMNAAAGGANRLELCANLVIGGTTPSPKLFEEIRKLCDVKIHVLIRPRFGDFCYSHYECTIIRQEVEMFRELGADGVVIGVLKPEGTLNGGVMEGLIGAAGAMSVTLHRAFDVCRDPWETFQQAKELGVHTILTSGQKDHCLAGKELIRDLVCQAGDSMDILVAGGVSAEVIEQMRPFTKATSFHMSGKVTLESPMVYRREGVNMGLPSLSEFEIFRTSEEQIRMAKHALEQLD